MKQILINFNFFKNNLIFIAISYYEITFTLSFSLDLIAFSKYPTYKPR